MTDFGKGDFQNITRYTIDTLIDDEDADSPITKVLEYWLELKNGGQGAPRADQFDIAKLWQMKFPNHVTITDCSMEDPGRFQIIYRAHDAGNIPRIYGDRVTGLRLGDMPCRLHSRYLQRDYVGAKADADPSTLHYQRIKQRIRGYCRDYTRLLLPFAAPDGTIGRIMAVSRPNHPPYFDPFPDTVRDSSNRWSEW